MLNRQNLSNIWQLIDVENSGFLDFQEVLDKDE